MGLSVRKKLTASVQKFLYGILQYHKEVYDGHHLDYILPTVKEYGAER